MALSSQFEHFVSPLYPRLFTPMLRKIPQINNVFLDKQPKLPFYPSAYASHTKRCSPAAAASGAPACLAPPPWRRPTCTDHRPWPAAASPFGTARAPAHGVLPDSNCHVLQRNGRHQCGMTRPQHGRRAARNRGSLAAGLLRGEDQAALPQQKIKQKHCSRGALLDRTALFHPPVLKHRRQN